MKTLLTFILSISYATALMAGGIQESSSIGGSGNGGGTTGGSKASKRSPASVGDESLDEGLRCLYSLNKDKYSYSSNTEEMVQKFNSISKYKSDDVIRNIELAIVDEVPNSKNEFNAVNYNDCKNFAVGSDSNKVLALFPAKTKPADRAIASEKTSAPAASK